MTPASPTPVDSEYRQRIAEIHLALGIPTDYAAKRQLPLCVEANALTRVDVPETGRDCYLTPDAAFAWRAMKVRAAASGVELVLLSGFRDVERQTEIVRGKLLLGETVEHVLRSIAAPGYSEHHTGRAVDIGTPRTPPLEEAFAASAAYAWLTLHAHEYGFRLSYPKNNLHGLVFEPWHWYWHS